MKSKTLVLVAISKFHETPCFGGRGLIPNNMCEYTRDQLGEEVPLATWGDGHAVAPRCEVFYTDGAGPPAQVDKALAKVGAGVYASGGGTAHSETEEEGTQAWAGWA